MCLLLIFELGKYWEPAKFAAELRHRASKNTGPIVLKMDMDSGVYLLVNAGIARSQV